MQVSMFVAAPFTGEPRAGPVTGEDYTREFNRFSMPAPWARRVRGPFPNSAV